MSKKIYICNECGFNFPSQLSGLIESKIQVFCEKCGTPFSLSGVSFTKRKVKPKVVTTKWEKQKKYTYPQKQEKTYPSLYNAIQKLNEISYIPVLIGSIIAILFSLEIFFNPAVPWLVILIRQLTLGIFGILIALFDKIVIQKKIKEGKLGEVLVHSLWIGILGSFIYGTGTFIMIKGIFVFLYVIYTREKNKLKSYEIWLYIKNSYNQFSSLIGFILLAYVFHTILADGTYILIQNFVIGIIENVEDPDILIDLVLNNLRILIGTGLFTVAIVFLSLDLYYRKEIHNTQIFETGVAIRTFVFGILATLFFAVGIFILFKAITIFILITIKPPNYKEKELKFEVPLLEQKTLKTGEKEVREEEQSSIQRFNPYVKTDGTKSKETKREEIQKEIIKIRDEEEPIKDSKKEEIKKEVIKIKEEKPVKEKIKDDKLKEQHDIELKLHESILPVKNKKDRKLVKEYFSKIFTLLSNDIREKIKQLKIPKKEKEELLRELAFLTKEQQFKYIEAITKLYQEKIPRKLVDKIRKIPNVKPEHYKKIVKQLKYMDEEEQIEFIHFLEKYA